MDPALAVRTQITVSARRLRRQLPPTVLRSATRWRGHRPRRHRHHRWHGNGHGRPSGICNEFQREQIVRLRSKVSMGRPWRQGHWSTAIRVPRHGARRGAVGAEAVHAGGVRPLVGVSDVETRQFLDGLPVKLPHRDGGRGGGVGRGRRTGRGARGARPDPGVCRLLPEVVPGVGVEVCLQFAVGRQFRFILQVPLHLHAVLWHRKDYVKTFDYGVV